jgi:hypothetical protein
MKSSYFSTFRASLFSRKAQRKERGTIMPAMVLGLVAFLAIGSLAIDVSHQITAGVELQNAADAAVRAGVAELNGRPDGITKAVDRALAVANTYDWGTPIVFSRNDVRFAVSGNEFNNSGAGRTEAAAAAAAVAPQIAYIRVKIPMHQIKGVFTKVSIGKQYLGVTREAIAAKFPNGIIPPAADAPVGTPATITNTSTVNTVCDWVPLSVLQHPTTYEVLSKATGFENCGDPYRYTPGCVYVIKAGSNGNATGFVAGGNFQALAPLSNGYTTRSRGGSDLRVNLAGGVDSCIHPGDWIGTEPGNNSGTVRQGLNARFGDYNGFGNANDARAAYPPDTNVKENITYQQYRTAQSGTTNSTNFQAPSSGTGVKNRRVIVLPIINYTEFNAGRDQVRLFDMGAFFLRSKVSNGQGDVVAEYVGVGYTAPQTRYDPSIAAPSNGAKTRGLNLSSTVK